MAETYNKPIGLQRFMLMFLQWDVGYLKINRSIAHFITNSVSSHPDLLAVAPSQMLLPGIVMRLVLGTGFGFGFPFGTESPSLPQSKLHHS